MACETILGAVEVRGDSRVTVDGAEFQNGLFVHDNATVDFLAGAIIDEEDLEAFESSIVNIHGGYFTDDLDAKDSSVLNIYGGTLTHALWGGEVSGQLDATVNIFGTGLRFGESNEPSLERYQHVIGTLADSTALDVDVWTAYGGQILLHNVPEPTSCGLLYPALVCTFLAFYRGSPLRKKECERDERQRVLAQPWVAGRPHAPLRFSLSRPPRCGGRDNENRRGRNRWDGRGTWGCAIARKTRESLRPRLETTEPLRG